MKTTSKQENTTSQTVQPKANKQAPNASILQTYKDKTAQHQSVEEGILLQGKFETVQRMELDEEEPIQRISNNTGLPSNLKSGIENLSGYSMDEVKVHYNSSRPASLQAHAYAQGTDIHVAPGQEKHLPHEVWHVVQQKQGRVKPTMQLRGVNVNDDAGLEKEADVMGMKAIQMYESKNPNNLSEKSVSGSIIQPSMIRRGVLGLGGLWFGRNYYQQRQALENPDQVDPNGRLGAMLAAGRFHQGQVGYGVQPAIRLIHGVFGNIGQQQIGRVFNGPEAQEIMAAPRDPENNRRLGEIEHNYWQEQQGHGENLPDEAMIRFGANVNPVYRGNIQELLAQFRERADRRG